MEVLCPCCPDCGSLQVHHCVNCGRSDAGLARALEEAERRGMETVAAMVDLTLDMHLSEYRGTEWEHRPGEDECGCDVLSNLAKRIRGRAAGIGKGGA